MLPEEMANLRGLIDANRTAVADLGARSDKGAPPDGLRLHGGHGGWREKGPRKDFAGQALAAAALKKERQGSA